MNKRLLFPGPEWAKAYCEALNNSEEYRRAGKTWKAGDILFIVENLPENISRLLGSRKVGFKLDLHEGVCRGVEYYTDPDKADAAFVITASYQDWVKVVTGKLHPTTALMTRKLRVVKGNVAILLRYAQAAIAMVKAAQSVPTEIA